MALSVEQLKGTLRNELVTRLDRAGYSPKRLGEVQRELLWWAWARAQAGRSLRPLLRGWGIAWGSSGYAELVPAEVPRAGRRQVTVLMSTSAVSPGTERAQHLRLPNADVGLLGRPGYSAAGVAISVGRGVTHVQRGDAVAVTGAAHASVATVPENAVYRIPRGVSMEAASMVMLGVISGQGVERASLLRREGFCVVGAGLVGALALRLAAAGGAHPLAVIARSREKEALALAGGARRFLCATQDQEAIANLDAPVVIEATGDPEAVSVAIAAAAVGGRVVLLGSSRGITSNLPVDEMRAKRLELLGAHVDTLDHQPAAMGASARRRHGERFLDALADSRLVVTDLAGPALDPREAGLFYRRLTRTRDIVGAHFDWTRLPDPDRAQRGHILRVPDVAARGVEPERRPLPLLAGGGRRGRPALLQLGDPFAGARGRLRIGLLGCGDIATHNAAAIVAAPNTQLVATFDPAQALAQDVANRFGGQSSPTADALIEREDVDAVLLCVPHHLHAPLAIQAAQAGRHVVVEKPPANNLQAAVAMAAAATEAGVALSICFPQRFEPEVMLARRMIEAGVLGKFQGSTIKLYLDKTPAYWIGGFSSRSQSDWRLSRERAGGGVLIMNLSHHIDVVRHLAGIDPVSISAVADAVDQPSDVEDAVSVSVTFRNGAVGSLVGSSAVRGTTASELRVWGSDGHVVIEPAPRVFTLRAIDGVRTGRWQTFGRLPTPRSRAIYFSRLATALDQGEPPDVSAADGLAVQAFIEAAYRSSAEGSSVRPDDLIAEARA